MKFFLTQVWPKLNQEIPDVSMTIIGRSPPIWMQQLQEKYPNLTITGFVDDVRPYIAKPLYMYALYGTAVEQNSKYWTLWQWVRPL